MKCMIVAFVTGVCRNSGSHKFIFFTRFLLDISVVCSTKKTSSIYYYGKNKKTVIRKY